jgi:hypothetical protein
VAKYIQIQIENPCRQKWEDMQATASGSFCSSCQKTVIDFTGMTDSQLMEYFRKHPAGVCGRIYTDQLETKLEIPTKKIPWLKYFFRISIPAMLLSYKAGAQRMLKKQTEAVVVTTKKLHKCVTAVQARMISGSISGSDGKPVAFASIMVRGTNEGTTADSNGLFRLRIPGTVRTLEISAVGYEKKEVISTANYIDVRLNVKTMENIILTTARRERTSITMGAMVSGISISYISGKEKTGITVQPVQTSAEIFPNPVKRDGILNIRWKKPVSNNQQLIIYNASGIKLLQETIGVKQSLLQTQVNLDFNAAGYYLCEITDVKSQEREVLKLIVE